jgi:hypothetical protein
VKLRKVLIAIGILVLLAVLIPIIHHYQLRFATSRYIARLKAKGEPMELAHLVPPPVPADQNSADTFLKAVALSKGGFSLLTGNYYDCMKMVAPGKAMICSQQPKAQSFSSTNSWDEVAAAVNESKEPFDLLQQIIDKPMLDFHVSYEKGSADMDFNSFHFVDIRQTAAMRLQDAALSDLHRGDAGSAAKKIRAMLALVKAMRTQHLVISELVRMSLAHITLGSTWELLQFTNVTDEQLAPLQRDWEAIDFVDGEEKALEMERVLEEITMREWRRSDAGLWRTYYSAPPPGPSPNATIEWAQFKSQIFYWKYWWSYSDELLMLKGQQVSLDTVRSWNTNTAWPVIQQEMSNNLAKLSLPTNSDDLWLGGKTDLRYAAASSVGAMSRYLFHAVRAEGAKQLVTEAIALKRYQLRHGAYPTNAATLVPEFLSEPVSDPIDGQPLRYHLNPDGTFLLYSVGEDGKDDHGDPTSVNEYKTMTWYYGRDWVWPQPATSEEIEHFRKSPPK